MRGAARQRAPRRARPADHPAAAARRAGAADRRRSRGAGVGRGRRFRAGCAAPGPIAALTRERFRRGRAHAGRGLHHPPRPARRLIHHDAVNRMLRGRRGARLTALTSGGAIPDTADYQVVLEPENQIDRHGQRGLRRREPGRRHLPARQHSYRILRVERGIVRVEDAHGQPPTIPFWLGEAPGRSDELSAVGVAAARGDRRRGLRQRPEPAKRATLADGRDRHRRSRRASSSSSTWPPRTPRSAACRRRTRSCSSASSTRPAACSS